MDLWGDYFAFRMAFFLAGAMLVSGRVFVHVIFEKYVVCVHVILVCHWIPLIIIIDHSMKGISTETDMPICQWFACPQFFLVIQNMSWLILASIWYITYITQGWHLSTPFTPRFTQPNKKNPNTHRDRSRWKKHPTSHRKIGPPFHPQGKALTAKALDSTEAIGPCTRSVKLSALNVSAQTPSAASTGSWRSCQSATLRASPWGDFQVFFVVVLPSWWLNNPWLNNFYCSQIGSSC